VLDHQARSAAAVDSSYEASVFAGIGIFNHNPARRPSPSTLRPWLRLAHGFSTPSSIGDILSGTIEDDPQPNDMTSIFLGLPLGDQLFNLPLDLYLTPGLAMHHKSSSQSRAYEYVVAIKGFYRISWPVLLRVGLGTGFSWISEISTLERRNNEEKGYKPSHFLHFLDFSLDLNLGRLLRYSPLEGSWFGAGVHHRSAIFESAQQYGRIKGGSNYPMIYFQVEF
jgi:outer membrane protein